MVTMKLHEFLEPFVEKNDFETERCSLGDKGYWLTKELAQCPGIRTTLDIASMDLDIQPWDLKSFWDFIGHCIDVSECDMKYPVILHPKGWVMNGWHRIAKALLEGKTTIDAIRLTELPKFYKHE